MIKKYLSYVSSGVLYAGAAIGVSHLVQSTRAGALYGFGLLSIIVLINIIKYPFFEAGARYNGCTGQSLIQAYKKIDPKILYFYIVQTLFTMFIIQSAVTIVTAGLLQSFLGLDHEIWFTSAIISASCFFIIFNGHYQLLQSTTKWIVILLTITTFIAFILAINLPVTLVENTRTFDFESAADIAFLVALIGWMPAPIDISVWQSVWRKDSKMEIGLKPALVDFHVGYWLTIVIGFFFISLGALIIYHSGETLATSGGAFATQLVDMYATSIGSWAWPIVAFAAFATMYSTCLTCLDASPRVIRESLTELNVKNGNYLYFILLAASAIGAVVIPLWFGHNMISMVDFATTVSFITAPIFALLNYIISHFHLEKKDRPGMLNKVISIIGLIGLYSFAGYFLYSKLF